MNFEPGTTTGAASPAAYGYSADGTPLARMIPPVTLRGGVDTDGDGKVDYYVKPRMNKANQVRHLNQYIGYFESADGDFPVSVVATSIKEAAKILTMPGVFGDDVNEPIMIKFVKGSVAVSVPVNRVGFTTEILPAGAVDSGAFATPEHAEVDNGTDVIFTANEPFGWKFDGWYKGEVSESTKLASTRQATIDVYDPYSTLIKFIAHYVFDAKIRNGTYMDVYRGNTYALDLDGYGTKAGRLVINPTDVLGFYFTIESISANESGKVMITVKPDQSVVQNVFEDPNGSGEQLGEITLILEPTYVGVNVAVQAVSGITEAGVQSLKALGIEKDAQITLKWVM